MVLKKKFDSGQAKFDNFKFIGLIHLHPEARKARSLRTTLLEYIYIYI